jgi:hypothetical protein
VDKHHSTPFGVPKSLLAMEEQLRKLNDYGAIQREISRSVLGPEQLNNHWTSVASLREIAQAVTDNSRIFDEIGRLSACQFSPAVEMAQQSMASQGMADAIRALEETSIASTARLTAIASLNVVQDVARDTRIVDAMAANALGPSEVYEPLASVPMLPIEFEPPFVDPDCRCDELETENQALRAHVEAQGAELAALRRKVLHLKQRLVKAAFRNLVDYPGPDVPPDDARFWTD